MPKSKDRYRKMRRAIKKANRYKMKGGVRVEFLRSVARKLFIIVVVAVSASGCWESSSVTGASVPSIQTCVAPSPIPLGTPGPVELKGAFCK